MLLFICNLKLSIGSRLYQVKVTPSAPQNKSMLFTASTAIWPLSKHPFMPLLRRREMFRSTPHPTCERKDWKEGKKGRMEGEGERKEERRKKERKRERKKKRRKQRWKKRKRDGRGKRTHKKGVTRQVESVNPTRAPGISDSVTGHVFEVRLKGMQHDWKFKTPPTHIQWNIIQPWKGREFWSMPNTAGSWKHFTKWKKPHEDRYCMIPPIKRYLE